MANSYLNRTPSGAGNKQKFTFSVWIKKLYQATGTNRRIVSSYFSNGGRHAFLAFGTDEQLYAFSGNYTSGGSTTDSYRLNSSRKFRDTNAWYHIVYRVDTTQSTASDRIRCYVNGELLAWDTSHSDHLYPSQSDENYLNSDYPIQINALNGNGIMDCCMSHIAFVDGQSLAPTVFGETDSTSGIWKFKSPSGVTWGTNGFHLKFENSAALGTDSSGNTNTFTVNGNLKQALDTPSNVYATLNPLDYSPNPATLQNGNTTYNKSSTGSGHNASMTGTLGAMTGKWYYEFKPTNTSSFVAGMIRTNHGLPNGEGYYGTDAGSYSITNSGKIVGGSESSVSYSYSANDIFGMAYDLDNGKFYVHVNGTYLTSGNPTSGSTGTGSLGDIALGSNIYVPLVSNANYGQTNLMHFNFGNGYFGTTAITSAGSNGNGSLFEYDVPSGYYALNTKNINTYG